MSDAGEGEVTGETDGDDPGDGQRVTRGSDESLY